MAKWCGVVGYSNTNESSPGVWDNDVTERRYIGDTIRITSRWIPSSDSTNDDLNINNQISIIADPFAYDNFCFIKYVEFMGTKWKVTNAEVERPRLILTLGGVYNG